MDQPDLGQTHANQTSLHKVGLDQTSVNEAKVDEISCHAGDRLLVFAPHPDDESLACGGLIQRAQAVGAQVSVVIATDGDANPWPQRLIEKRWHLGPDATRRWGVLRGNEARAALQTMGVHEGQARFLHWADQGLTKRLMEQGEASVVQLRQLIDLHRPTLVAMPSILDSHPDHSALALMLNAALRAEASDARFLSYWLHGRDGKADGAGSQLTLTPDQLVTKRAAALSHFSQTRFGSSRLLRFVRAHEQFLQPLAAVPQTQTQWRWHFRARGTFGITAARQIRIVAISPAGEFHAASFDLREAIRSGHLRVIRRSVRSIEVEIAPLWNGPLWTVAKLETNHLINVYDEFAWTQCIDAAHGESALAADLPPQLPECEAPRRRYGRSTTAKP